jgi:hypothetical protein
MCGRSGFIAALVAAILAAAADGQVTGVNAAFIGEPLTVDSDQEATKRQSLDGRRNSERSSWKVYFVSAGGVSCVKNSSKCGKSRSTTDPSQLNAKRVTGGFTS